MRLRPSITNRYRVRSTATLLLGMALSPALAQTQAPSFLIEPNRPIVYLHVSRLGFGLPEEDGKRHQRVWFELHNNCAQPITVRVNGAPPGSPNDDGSLMDTLVRSEASVARKGKMPFDTSSDVGSLATVEPGEALHFSLPANHFNRAWEVHIPFNFKLPAGKCCRDERAWGGTPEMFLTFSFSDLPQAMRIELDKSRGTT